MKVFSFVILILSVFYASSTKVYRPVRKESERNVLNIEIRKLNENVRMCEARIEDMKAAIKDKNSCPIKLEEKSMDLDSCAISLSDCVNMKQDQKMIR